MWFGNAAYGLVFKGHLEKLDQAWELFISLTVPYFPAWSPMIPSLNNSSYPFADLDFLIITYELENICQFMWFPWVNFGN